MRIAVLVKQIPSPEELRLEHGRLVRDGVPLEVNAYCRRANAKAVELAGDDGEVVVFTMGPPTGDDALREMVACGATRAVHLCDARFAGADTLATARALAAAITREGPFDLVLAGLNSLDADTGQVGPEVAELLGLPFAAGVRELDLDGTRFRARLETDDGSCSVEGTLPAVLSTAERLCDPSKAPPEARAEVDAGRIVLLTADDLGLSADEIGEAGSPTTVGTVRAEESSRLGRRAATVAEAVQMLEELGALDGPSPDDVALVVPPTGGDGPQVWCFVEPSSGAASHELLGEAAALASAVGGSVTAVVPAPVPPGLGARGADRVLVVPDADHAEQWADALAAAAADELPWVLLVEGTRTGRAMAAVVAARNGWGLTGDAIGLEVSPDGRLLAWKPAFGGRLVAPIESTSPVQMATVRPGVLARRQPRDAEEPPREVLPVPAAPRVLVTTTQCDDEGAGELLRADVVVGVGTGVDPGEYELLRPLQEALGGAPLAATRKVTDKGWLPRSRQIGVTGHAISPRLYVAVGMSGRFNHVVGIRKAGAVLAVDNDPSSAMFDQADVGIVGDWHRVVPALATALLARSAESEAAVG